MGWHQYMHNWTTTSFMNIQCSQHAVDFTLWELLLNANPDIRNIVELGTLHGGFSIFLFLQSIQRGIEFSTFDLVHASEHTWECMIGDHAYNTPLGKLLDLESVTYIGNIFEEADTKSDVVEKITAPGKTLLFCDNGKKPLEVATFVPYLEQGDLVVVHDWETEFTQDDVIDCMEEIFTDVVKSISVMTRIFKVK